MEQSLSRPLHLKYFFPVSPETLFDYWIKPEFVKGWLFKSDTNEISQVKIDPKTGGRFSILEKDERKEIDHFGEFTDIKRPSCLSFTLEVPEHFSGTSFVKVQIDRKAKGAEMHFSQTGIDTNQTETNWRMMFERLSELLKINSSTREAD